MSSAACNLDGQNLELDPTTHEEHVEIVEGYGNVLERPGGRERGISGDKFDLGLDVLVGGIEIERRGVDRLIDGEIPFRGL